MTQLHQNIPKVNLLMIQQIAIKTRGALVPSKFNSEDWKRILGTKLFGAEGIDLAAAIARMAKQLCSEKSRRSRINFFFNGMSLDTKSGCSYVEFELVKKNRKSCYTCSTLRHTGCSWLFIIMCRTRKRM